MKAEIYIILTRRGVARMTKRASALGRDEIAVKLRLFVPDSAFRSPIITADLDVPDQHVIQPSLTIDVIDDPQGTES